MKKTYIEPKMIVEDFTVSEMVAGNCRAPSSEIGLAQQMNQFQPVCPSGAETGWTEEMGTAYADLSDLYEGRYDVDRKRPNNEFCFTSAFRDYTAKEVGNPGNICEFMVDKESVNFIPQVSLSENTAQCSTDDGILLNS